MSGLYTKLVAAAVFPAQETLKGHTTVAVRKQLEQSQWWAAQRLQDWQDRRVRELVSHASLHVPYFRDVFGAITGGAAAIRSAADLAQLPFLTKSIIRTEGDRMKSAQARHLAPFNTGGSSGEPLKFWISRERVSHDVAAKWRATRWWGVDIGDRELVVWGSPIELGAHDRIRRLRDALMRTRLLPAFDMSESKIRDWFAQMRAWLPRMLFGYPSALSLIATQAEKDGVRLDDLGIRVVFVTSERLYDHQRAIISRVFGCPVANGYGGRDAGFIAHECPAGGMHITAEDIVVEIIDEAGQPTAPGIAGEIVVTHLATAGYPFIRYRTGDVGALSGTMCSCGRTLPLLERIEGRSTDFVVKTDGTLMHGLGLIYVIRDLPGVAGFKIIQHSSLHTHVLLVPEGKHDPAINGTIIAGFKQRLGADAEITIESVASIPAEKSGKFGYIVSHARNDPVQSALNQNAPNQSRPIQ